MGHEGVVNRVLAQVLQGQKRLRIEVFFAYFQIRIRGGARNRSMGVEVLFVCITGLRTTLVVTAYYAN